MPAPSHTLYTLTLFLALSSKDAEKHSSACPSACSDEGPSRGMPATCAVRDHWHHICSRSYGPNTSPARGQVGTRNSIDELVLTGSAPVSATMFS